MHILQDETGREHILDPYPFSESFVGLINMQYETDDGIVHPDSISMTEEMSYIVTGMKGFNHDVLGGVKIDKVNLNGMVPVFNREPESQEQEEDVEEVSEVSAKPKYKITILSKFKEEPVKPKRGRKK